MSYQYQYCPQDYQTLDADKRLFFVVLSAWISALWKGDERRLNLPVWWLVQELETLGLSGIETVEKIRAANAVFELDAIAETITEAVGRRADFYSLIPDSSAFSMQDRLRVV